MNKKNIRNIQLIWTISDRYDIKPRSILFDEERTPYLDEWRLIVIGGLYKFIPKQYIDDFLLRIIGLGNSTKYFIEIFLCLAQEYVIPKLADKYALMSKLEEHYKIAINKELKGVKIEIERDRLSREYFSIEGVDRVISGVDRDIVTTMKRGRELSSADEFMKLLYEIFNIYIGSVPKKYINDNDFQDDMYKMTSEVLKKSESSILEDDYTLDDTVLNAEFSHNCMEDEVDKQLEAVDDIKLFSSHADSHAMFGKILYNYGTSKFSDRQRIELEQVVSKDIHKGCKIHYVSNFMNEAKGFKREYISEQYNANIEYYEENKYVYDKNIKNLVAIIREKILTDLEDTYFNLDRGSLDKSRVYRFPVLNDNKVFKKEVKDNIGTIAITMLIDSSGSQLARQKQISTWAYIIAQAFLLCDIPIKVVGFNNLFDYTIFREYRDFNDTISKNKDIFYFTAEGTNRDGLAIKTCSYLMKNKPQDKKLIIVLSDGKPNDVRIGVGTHIVSGHDTIEYTGMDALEDTAKMVRKSRGDGVEVIGIYTGERDDIHTQKLIYGKEFAYVPDLDELGNIVGKVIERVIKNN